MKLSAIFEEKPERWGFRGDPHFWDHLKKLAEDMDIIPPDALEAWIKKEYFSLSGKVMTNEYGDFAKTLTADLRHGRHENVVLAYQPQYDYSGECIGVEALLRWKHPQHGFLYPPLIFKLAEEGGFLEELEQTVLLKALDDRPAVIERFGPSVKLSVNVTGTTVTTPQFIEFCAGIRRDHYVADYNICLEVTEQAALRLDEKGINALTALKDMGFKLAIDDFSMGQTSLHYLKDGVFDLIKLDGSLVKGLTTHESYKNIVASITGLASSMNISVLAEFVETEAQREQLHELGCDNYQGYLYSKAVFLDEVPALKAALEKE